MRYIGGRKLDLSELANFLIALFTGVGAGLALTLIASGLTMRRKQKRKMESSLMQFVTDYEDMRLIQKIVEEALEAEGKSRKATFAILFIDAETRLRKLAIAIDDSPRPKPLRDIVDKLVRLEILAQDWNSSFGLLWNIRNRVFHGLNVSDEEIRLGSTLAGALILTLDRLYRAQHKRPDNENTS